MANNSNKIKKAKRIILWTVLLFFMVLTIIMLIFLIKIAINESGPTITLIIFLICSICIFAIYAADVKRLDEAYKNNIKIVRESLNVNSFKRIYLNKSFFEKCHSKASADKIIAEKRAINMLINIIEQENINFFAKIEENNSITVVAKNSKNEIVYSEKIESYDIFLQRFLFEEA